MQLALEIPEPSPAHIGAILKQAVTTLKFQDVLDSSEHVAGFIRTMYGLCCANGQLAGVELAYVRKVCDASKMSLELIPNA